MMNLSELGNVLTEMPSGDILGETKGELSVIDLDTGNLSVSPTQYDSSFEETNGSSASMVKPDVSDADHLLSAFDSTSIANIIEPTDYDTKDGYKADDLDSNGHTDISGPKNVEEKDTSKFDSIDLPTVAEPSAQGSANGEGFNGIDKTSQPNCPLILYTSSQRHGRSVKSNQIKEAQEKHSECGRMAQKKPVVDISSLQILRKSRSSFSKQPRSSVWGCLGVTVSDSKESDALPQNLGSEKTKKRVQGGRRKRNSRKGQIHQEQIGKRYPLTSRISLKIKIGNKLCSMGNANETCSSSGKDHIESMGTVENLFEEKVPGDISLQHEGSSEKLSSDAYALSRPPDVKVAFDNSSVSTSSNFHHLINPEVGYNLAASIENLCSDVGTSPDSEVINTVPDVPPCEKGLQYLQNSPIISNARVSPSDKKSMKGNKKLHEEGNCALEKLNGAEAPNNATEPLCIGDVSSMSMTQTESRKGKKKVKFHELADCSLKTKQIGAETPIATKEPSDVEVDQKLNQATVTSSKPYLDYAETEPCPELETGPNTEVCNAISFSNGRKSSRAKGGSHCRSKISDMSSKKDKSSKREGKDKSSKKKGNKNKGGVGHSVSEKIGAEGALSKVESLHAAGNQFPTVLEEIGELSNDSTAPLNSLEFSSDGVVEQHIPSRDAWVLCDECEKWRRIPATLADEIEETDCRWTCKENTDRNFADCSIPQEKSDAAINQELGISDASCEEDVGGTFLKPIEIQPKAVQQSSWSLIKSNLFLHRSRKTQTIDEVMVCHCKPPTDGRMGCGATCLNRVLNIECVQGTCPCGEFCSNQQFQKRNYAKLKWFKCGKKGYGLRALEDISIGQFLIEYVGEVLDVRAYEARQREYALNGHKHFYFMTLNGSEVIDACAKGNLGRFINHSCDPNCRTEKWMVNGEVCIGLFSLTDIKKGEEVTFDYNYVRVFGAAAKKCVCGSPNCRGYIGGDPTNSEVIVQDDSDDEFSEPVMVCEDRGMNEEWNEIISSSLHDKENEITHEPTKNRDDMEMKLSTTVGNIPDSQGSEFVTKKVEGINSAQVVGTVVENNSFGDGLEPLEIINQSDDSLNGSELNTVKSKPEDLQSQMPSAEPVNILLQTNGNQRKEMSSAPESVVTTASPSKLLSDTVESKRKLKCASLGGRDGPSEPNSRAKTKRSSSSVKKRKPKASVMNDRGSPDGDKLSATLHKSKKLTGLSLTNHFEAVEEKLNELLDPEGGISKRKDASRGYLKLLFLTAASGNNGHGEAIQSNRDLSMILDVLLKTRSRSVLVDIINKNGLQMLHNIMKRYRKEYIKTPILRKLLKVLEHLAWLHILTLEHITGGPPCPGVESFKDSILNLTEHADKQVHQIARSFRDRWIPRSLRKSCCIQRDDGRTEINQHSSHDGLLTANIHRSDTDGIHLEARINSCEKQFVAASPPSTVEVSTLDSSASGVNGTKVRKRKSRWDSPVAENPHSRTSPNLVGNKQLSIDEDIPPGFSSPCHGRALQSDTSADINHEEIGMQKQLHPWNVTLGVPHPRFNARMPVSYGISKSFVQQFGVPQPESSDCWAIAPGVTFLPFPPLPSYPCGSGDLPTSASVTELTEKSEPLNDTCTTYQVGQKRMRTCGMDQPVNNFPVPDGLPDNQQGASNGLGRKFFRQQKWNHSKLAPPWVRMRSCWGYAGNNAPNNSQGMGSGNGTNRVRNLYNWQETNRRG